MTRRDATELMLRACGVYAWLRALDYIFLFVPLGIHIAANSPLTGAMFALSPVVLVAVGVVLILKAKPLAGHLVFPEDRFEHAGYGWMALVLQGLGLAIAISVMPAFSAVMSFWRAAMQQQFGNGDWGVTLVGPLLRIGVLLAAGIVLFLASHRLCVLLVRKTPPEVDQEQSKLDFLQWQYLVLGAMGVYLFLTAIPQAVDYAAGLAVRNRFPRSFGEEKSIQLHIPLRIAVQFVIGVLLMMAPGGVQRLWARARTFGHDKHPDDFPE